MGKHAFGILSAHLGLFVALAGGTEAKAQHVLWERGRGSSSGILSSERCRPLQRLVEAALEAEKLEEIPALVEHECNSMRVGLFDVGTIGPPGRTRDVTGGGPPARKRDVTGGGPPAHAMDVTGGGPPAHTRDVTGGGPPAHTMDVTGGGPPALMRLIAARSPGSQPRAVSYPVTVPAKDTKAKACPVKMEPEAPSKLSGLEMTWTDDEQSKWVKESEFPHVKFKVSGEKIYIESANCHFSVVAPRRR